MNYREGSVATDVEKRVDFAGTVLDYKERIPSDFVADVFASLSELKRVRDEDP